MTQATCTLCGEPMQPGEEMFKYHGSLGPCPKPPLARRPTQLEEAMRVLRLIAEWSGDEFTGEPVRSQHDMFRLARDFIAKAEGV